MKVLFVASEAGPFIASGGLGDVMGALPPEVSKKGQDTSVILPLYDTIKEEYKKAMEWVADISFSLSWRKTGAAIYKLKHSSVDYYFVENHYYFDRGRLYGEFDDAERFAFFCRAVLEFILNTGLRPDIIHANDWQAAMSIVYLKTEYQKYDILKNIRTVYTIHNIEYQGKFDPYILGDVFGLDYKFKGLLEYDGCLNLMKGAIVAADSITTVSPGYAEELHHDFFAFGLAEIIKENAHKLSGVINGIDYGVFSPEKGKDIYRPYKLKDMKEGKAENKRKLQEELLLPSDGSPLVVMITRLASQKGIDLLLCILDELLSEKLQLVILGTGEGEYENALSESCKKHSNLRAILSFNRALSKKLYAAADIFLMPSKSEPCGLSQMIACSYGAVPVVRSVGGLKDTIIPYGEKKANGFRFDNYNAHELLFTVKDAVSLYNEEEKWNQLSISAKRSKFKWDASAEKYISIYANLLN